MAFGSHSMALGGSVRIKSMVISVEKQHVTTAHEMKQPCVYMMGAGAGCTKPSSPMTTSDRGVSTSLMFGELCNLVESYSSILFASIEKSLLSRVGLNKSNGALVELPYRPKLPVIPVLLVVAPRLKLALFLRC